MHRPLPARARCGLTAALVWQLAGCTSVLSDASLRQVTSQLSLQSVEARPAEYRGQALAVAGILLQVENQPDVSILEILGYPPDARGFPDTRKAPIDRFLLRHPGFLDPLVYARGREIAAVGRVAGVRELAVGGAQRQVPLLDAVELKLLPVASGSGLPARIGVGFGFGL